MNENICSVSFRVTKVIFCSGKAYYDLLKERKDKSLDSQVAIIRIEELAPFPYDRIEEELHKFSSATSYVWFQEEHQNMGAWFYFYPRFQLLSKAQIRYVGRGPSCVSAVGLSTVHKKEVSSLYAAVFS